MLLQPGHFVPTLFFMKLIPEHLPEPPPVFPLLLFFSQFHTLLDKVSILLSCFPGSQPVQSGHAGDVVVLPSSIFLFSWSIRKEPASSNAPARPDTVLRRRRQWQDHWNHNLKYHCCLSFSPAQPGTSSASWPEPQHRGHGERGRTSHTERGTGAGQRWSPPWWQEPFLSECLYSTCSEDQEMVKAKFCGRTMVEMNSEWSHWWCKQ